ncbi:DUF6059 family protein [Streptomyces fragilis]|uniref:DUF6059 family protein n=1 Tax=Streptomyces fragilis TaxID=67301 RepID=A0ABV2YHJ2_9ACTN|nr:DUF6059 family protein [Streptomyces fragilis]
MRLLLVRRLAALGQAVIRFGLLWSPPPPPDPPGDGLTGPPPGHPERLCDEALPPELERLLRDGLG